MITKRTIFFMIFTISTIETMASENVCYIANVPVEIRNHIASYLIFNDRESDDEFIARTRAFAKVSDEYRLLVESQEDDGLFPDMDTGSSSRGTRRTYSVDGSKILSVELTNEPKVTIFDIHNETIQESRRLAELTKKHVNAVQCVALSRTYCNYAMLYTVEKRRKTITGPFAGSSKVLSITNYVAIKNVFSGKGRRFEIPGQYDNFISIGFNKQGTKIIVHAKENGYWDDVIPEDQKPESFYYTIPLTTPEKHTEKSAETLGAYLKHMLCCKDLANSLPKV